MLTDAVSQAKALPIGLHVLLPASKGVYLETGRYITRLAVTDAERDAVFRLRFRVFNLEMNEGLESSYIDGYDKDRFDEVCDHLMVEDRASGEVVGTYRLQRGETAKHHLGYYSEQEFCFAPYERMRSEIVELGRACILREHRSSDVLNLLWRGIARYALANGARFMIGCCSLTSQDAATGWAVYESLRNWMAADELRTVATASFALPKIETKTTDAQTPKLLRAYLTIGARICSEPAIDREFKTIDFLTLMDLQALHPRMAARFLEG